MTDWEELTRGAVEASRCVILCHRNIRLDGDAVRVAFSSARHWTCQERTVANVAMGSSGRIGCKYHRLTADILPCAQLEYDLVAGRQFSKTAM